MGFTNGVLVIAIVRKSEFSLAFPSEFFVERTYYRFTGFHYRFSKVKIVYLRDINFILYFVGDSVSSLVRDDLTDFPQRIYFIYYATSTGVKVLLCLPRRGYFTKIWEA